MTKVITYGTYDLLHYGHIRLLERAKELGDYLIVGVTADDFDKTRGKINVQQSLMERIEAVRATGLADEIIVEEYEGQKIDDIQRYGVDIFTVGSDWKGKFDYLNAYCKVVYLDRTEGVSSSEIRAEKRKIFIGTIGNKGLCDKFIKEVSYVNGVEYKECDEEYLGVDAVYIATLPEKHYSDVKRALEKGKHVICESPIAMNTIQCKELIEYAENNSLILVDGIKTAYSTAYSRLLVLAKSGHIGEILSIDSVCTSNRVTGITDLKNEQNSICAWGPTALLPIFQLAGVEYNDMQIVTKLFDKKANFDAFTKISFEYDKMVATAKVAKAAKSEGELIITGTKGYIYVPAPWWRTEYFEIRYENQNENKKYFYQLDGEGIRYEIVAFARAVENKKRGYYLKDDISLNIATVIERFSKRKYKELS
ncbi:adenylyltransferase/cytidyltransferase family protein [Agathobacter rectalis]|uniref:adenylyltransferase/cytidyltransferase family protein n=1 Tax=Agathobacter rectalis TaxID=39491 RepID=UPI0034A4C437